MEEHKHNIGQEVEHTGIILTYHDQRGLHLWEPVLLAISWQDLRG